MTDHTIATLTPGRRDPRALDDVDEVQVRRERGKLRLWIRDQRGRVVMMRDQRLLDELAAQLRRAGLGQRQAVIEEVADAGGS